MLVNLNTQLRVANARLAANSLIEFTVTITLSP